MTEYILHMNGGGKIPVNHEEPDLKKFMGLVRGFQTADMWVFFSLDDSDAYIDPHAVLGVEKARAGVAPTLEVSKNVVKGKRGRKSRNDPSNVRPVDVE